MTAALVAALTRSDTTGRETDATAGTAARDVVDDDGAAARAAADAAGAAARAADDAEEPPRARRRAACAASSATRRSATELEPLAPGERPTPITVAAIVAAALALINLVAMAAGATVHGHKASIPATIAFCAFAAVLAVGLWQVRYWAIIVFEALLAFALLLFSLLLLIASNVAAALICLAVIGLSGWLFWALVRADGARTAAR